jgi:hypothetical protein
MFWAKAQSPKEVLNTPPITRELTSLSRHLSCIQIEVTLVYSLKNVAPSNPRFIGYRIEDFAEVKNFKVLNICRLVFEVMVKLPCLSSIR